MIRSIKLHALRNSEYIQFMRDVLFIIDKNHPDRLKVTDAYASLKSLVDRIEDLFMVQKGSSITQEIYALDARRDNALNGILFYVNGLTYYMKEEVRQQAELLKRHLELYGIGIARDNLQSQTNTIRNILSEWDDSPELNKAIEQLNLKEWKAELSEANTLFAERYLARAEEAGKTSPDNIKGLRVAANEAWYSLRNKLAAYHTIDSNEPLLAPTIEVINVLIAQYSSLLLRKNRSLKGPE